MPNFAQILSRQKRAVGGRIADQGTTRADLASTGVIPRRVGPQLSAVSTGITRRPALTQGPSGTQTNAVGRLTRRADVRRQEEFEAERVEEVQRSEQARLDQQREFDARFEESQATFATQSQDFADRLAALRTENVSALESSQAAFGGQLSAFTADSDRRATEAETLRSAERKRIEDLIAGQAPAPAPIVAAAPAPAAVAPAPTLVDLTPGPVSQPPAIVEKTAAQKLAELTAEKTRRNQPNFNPFLKLKGGPGPGVGGLGISGPAAFGGSTGVSFA